MDIIVGYISPIPYIEFNKEIGEDIFKQYVEAISNEIVSWESIKSKIKEDRGITYANPKIANGIGVYEEKKQGTAKWVAGSTLCINLQKIEKIPPFYNPPGARGEDTFFSTWLNDCTVIKTPVYHFHDGFLKYEEIMKERYPKELKKVATDDMSAKKRFYCASLGWVKYKPLLLYITNRDHYEEEIRVMREKLQNSIPALDKMVKDFSFEKLIEVLNQYDNDVKSHYKEYIKTKEIWDIVKMNY